MNAVGKALNDYKFVDLADWLARSSLSSLESMPESGELGPAGSPKVLAELLRSNLPLQYTKPKMWKSGL